MKNVTIGKITIGEGQPLCLIAGPCVLEEGDINLRTAERLASIADRLHLSLIFKASFDKANRTSKSSFRGPGLERGLAILSRIREQVGLPVLTDIHEASQASLVAEVVDVLQIPAFLCRQTDLLLAAAETGKAVNVKKGQFLSPENMSQVIEKIGSTGNEKVLLSERGTFFGYGDLVVDMRSLPRMRSLGFPVFFDAGHSLQRPGAAGTHTAGYREFIPALARAAIAVGCDGIYLEVHPRPDDSPSDSQTIWPLDTLETLLRQLLAIRTAVEETAHA